MTPRAAAVEGLRDTRQGSKKNGGKGRQSKEQERKDGKGRWQHMKLYTQNNPAALYQVDRAANDATQGRPVCGSVSGDTAAGVGQCGVHADVLRRGTRVPAGMGTGSTVVGGSVL